MIRAMRVEQLGTVLTLILAVGVTASVAQTATAEGGQREAALGLEQQGKNVEAETAWRAFLRTHPQNSEAYAHLGLLEARQEHYKEAVPLYRNSLMLNPGMPGLRLNLGLALFKGGELRQSIQEFKSLLKTKPPASPEVQQLTILLGMAYYGLNEYAAAAPYLKKAAAQDPQNQHLRLALAHSCLWSRQYQCVLDVYHEMLTLNADSAEADMLAGEALDELKEYDGGSETSRRTFRSWVFVVDTKAVPGSGSRIAGRTGRQSRSRSGSRLSWGR